MRRSSCYAVRPQPYSAADRKPHYPCATVGLGSHCWAAIEGILVFIYMMLGEPAML